MKINGEMLVVSLHHQRAPDDRANKGMLINPILTDVNVSFSRGESDVGSTPPKKKNETEILEYFVDEVLEAFSFQERPKKRSCQELSMRSFDTSMNRDAEHPLPDTVALACRHRR